MKIEIRSRPSLLQNHALLLNALAGLDLSPAVRPSFYVGEATRNAMSNCEGGCGRLTRHGRCAKCQEKLGAGN